MTSEITFTTNEAAANPYYQALRAFGQFLKRLRIHNGHTQLSAAVGMGCETAQAVSIIEKSGVLPAKRLKTLCLLYNVDIEVIAERMAEIERLRLLYGVKDATD